ncbi:MAG: TraB/GumN family protein [Gammaproteobacteria bacterium]|nr:TraB/GumN family protein [Gammaproteobacteria bacterium]MDJ0871505.1 TraB/GumN family protein [Gammaproteobacteria bacterium]
MQRPTSQEPLITVDTGMGVVTVLGTAHVSKASADKVRELLGTGDYDAVGVELCPSRYNAIVNPDVLAKMDLLQVLREGKVPMVTASLALGAYQQRLAEQFGIEPGAEMRAAIEIGKEAKLPVLLLDREVGTTLKRIYRNVPWWRRLGLLAGLMASVVSREEVSEEEVERLKEGDILETAFVQFAEEAKDLYLPLIEERDRYMAARIRQELAQGEHRHALAVVGAGHVKGIAEQLARESSPQDSATSIEELDRVPVPSRWPKVLPWLIVALLVSGFIIGFSRSPALGWQLVADWVLINGGLAALGTLIAAGHPVTVIGAFLAAPLTSLNPMVGAGMVTAFIEIFMRKPSVGDFSRLRSDTTHLRGWWRNRVTRTLLVFMLSTLGSVVGTYLAGFRILERLVGS